MILQALVDYYEILAKASKISKPGYCIANVSYAINLSKNGELVGIIPLKLQVERGKKQVEVPQQMEVPEQIKKASGITSNFLCENSGYMLGIDNKEKPERAKDCFDAFCALHKAILQDLDCVQAKALLAFLDSWKPENASENSVIRDYYSEITSGTNLVFFLEGIGFIHENPDIKQAWENYKKSTIGSIKSQCLVTGKILPIARLHPSIKGFQPTGSSIVSFNARAYESYAHDEEQGLNAPVCEDAVFKYTTSLNYLLSDNNHKQKLADTTVVFWAESPNDVYQDLFNFALSPKQSDEGLSDDKKSSNQIGEIFKKIADGKPLSDIADLFDAHVNFFILGLSPNKSRLSIRFFIQDSFGNMIEKVMQHYTNMEIEPLKSQYIPLWKLMQETVFRDNEPSPLLTGAILRAILTGTPYPVALYNSIIVRIRAEREISHAKAAIIKAYLIKKQTKYKEVLTVSLNAQSENCPYVLGRLFAVLEKAQQDANPGIKATIKDRYFTSACATPATVFPVLLRLSNHHISKSDYGYVSDNKIRDLLDKFDVDNNPFPSHLTLEEQGIFILGYYHQQKANYEKINKEEK